MARPKKEIETTKVVKEVKAPVYTLTITIAGAKVMKGTGASALEALKSIDKPVKIFNKADIELKCGKKYMIQTWQPFKVKRLFFPIAQPLLAKQLEYLLR